MTTCPCCGYRTRPEALPGTFEICEICFWEFDPAQMENPDYGGGANRVSLRQAQKNYERIGASDPAMIGRVRNPTADEVRDPGWTQL